MSKEMVSKLVKKGVVVVRDGARVRPQLDKNFYFTQDEIDSINAATPGSLVNPISTEQGEAVPASVSKKATTGSKAEAAQAGAKGGKKKATANKADSEPDDDDKSDDDDKKTDDDL